MLSQKKKVSSLVYNQKYARFMNHATFVLQQEKLNKTYN